MLNSYVLLWFILGIIGLGLIIGFLISLGFGGQLGDRFSILKSQGKIDRRNKIVPLTSEPKKTNYFIKLGNNSKVPIEANEVADAKKRGYEILIE